MPRTSTLIELSMLSRFSFIPAAVSLLIGLSSCGAPTRAADPTALPNDLPESYMACGCGCCGGSALDDEETLCLYHSKGDDIHEIIEADRDASSDPHCAEAGCGLGTFYRYCD